MAQFLAFISRFVVSRAGWVPARRAVRSSLGEPTKAPWRTIFTSINLVPLRLGTS